MSLNRREWPDYQWILGHRGARLDAPENTLASFSEAMKLGADGVEFDVCMSLDEIPMIIHDPILDRLTSGTGNVADFTAKALRKFYVRFQNQLSSENIPSLEDTLDILPDGAIANIELKSRGRCSNSVFAEKTLSVIRKYADRLCIIVSSFDAVVLEEIKRREPSILLSLLLSVRDAHWPTSLRLLRSFSLDGLHLSFDLANLLSVTLAQAHNLKVGVWTVNDVDTAQELVRMGVDGIFTDNVSAVVKALRPASR